MIIRPVADDDELVVAAGVLARGFVDDPMVRWPMGGDLDDRASLEARMTTMFTEVNRQSVELGEIWITEDRSGVAVWLAPASTASFEEDDKQMRPRIFGLTDDGGERYTRQWDWVASRVPDEPLWYLDQLAVEPTQQGRGIGSALVEHGLAMARADGVSAFLETGNPDNIGYYERFGFVVIEEGDVPGGGPRVWFMRTT